MISNPGREYAGTNSCHMPRKLTRGTEVHTNEFKLVVTKLLLLFSSLAIYVKLLFVKIELGKA